MPYVEQWVEPEVALEHNGTTIYHAYEDDKYEARFRYHFALSPDAEKTFDVRDLTVPGAARAREPGRVEDIEAALREAIDAGLLSNPTTGPAGP